MISIEDETFLLKRDLQTCVANDMDFNSDYKLLLFSDENLDLMNCFSFFKNLKIKPSGSRMNFSGEIMTEIISEEAKKEIKKVAWRYSVEEMMKQKIETETEAAEISFTLEGEQYEKAMEQLSEVLKQAEEKAQYRKPTEFEKDLMKMIRKQLHSKDFYLEYEETEEMLILCNNFESVELNNDILNYMTQLCPYIDYALIAPVYDEEDEEDDECKQIRILFGIDLRKRG